VDDASMGKEFENPSDERSSTLYFPASFKRLRLPRM
jgi:hypothetical protein